MRLRIHNEPTEQEEHRLVFPRAALDQLRGCAGSEHGRVSQRDRNLCTDRFEGSDAKPRGGWEGQKFLRSWACALRRPPRNRKMG